jgi:hypothetical protein
MHDLDRTTLESDFGYESYDGEGFDSEALGEEELTELTGELLALGGEHELDHFLGSLFKKVAGKVGGALSSPLGKSLGGLLKTVAGKVLPMAGSALGNLVVPGLGGAIGGQLASSAGSALGLELEGLSGEEQEFQLARRFVQLAGDAAKNAAHAQGIDPRAAAVQALQAAAQKYAPGLLAALGRIGAPGNGAASPGNGSAARGEVLDEQDEMELVSQLLEVTDEYEVDRFLGNLLKKAGSFLGHAAQSPIGRALTGYLKQAAAGALPKVAQALGAAGEAELDGELGDETSEYELARDFVRFGSDAARRAFSSMGAGGNPLAIARQALSAAANRGYGSGYGQALAPGSCTGASEGRWYRRGNKIVIVGA